MTEKPLKEVMGRLPPERQEKIHARAKEIIKEQIASAWLHTMHMERNQTEVVVTISDENPWGEPGKEYSEEYEVTTEPLFTADALRAKDAEIERLRSDLSDADVTIKNLTDELAETYAENERLRAALGYVDRECTAAIAYEAEGKGDPDSIPNGLRTPTHIKLSMIRQTARQAAG